MFAILGKAKQSIASLKARISAKPIVAGAIVSIGLAASQVTALASPSSGSGVTIPDLPLTGSMFQPFVDTISSAVQIALPVGVGIMAFKYGPKFLISFFKSLIDS